MSLSHDGSLSAAELSAYLGSLLDGASRGEGPPPRAAPRPGPTRSNPPVPRAPPTAGLVLVRDSALLQGSFLPFLFLRAALDAGGTAVFVATETSEADVERVARKAGVGAGALRDRARVVALSEGSPWEEEGWLQGVAGRVGAAVAELAGRAGPATVVVECLSTLGYCARRGEEGDVVRLAMQLRGADGVGATVALVHRDTCAGSPWGLQLEAGAACCVDVLPLEAGHAGDVTGRLEVVRHRGAGERRRLLFQAGQGGVRVRERA